MRLAQLCVLIALGSATGCKPDSGASVQTLENFAAADGRKVTNQCAGTFALSKSLRVYAEPGRAGLMDGLIGAVAAVPPAIQETFFATDGGAIVATNGHAESCRRGAGRSAAEEQFNGEGSSSPKACLQANDARRKATIFVQPDPTAAQHAVVRMFGLLYAQVYGEKKYANWRQATELLATNFLADVAGNRELSIKPYEPLLKSSGGYATFVDFVFAEAFDSYYCNAGTRQNFSATFPKTYASFVALRQIWEPKTSAGFGLQDGETVDTSLAEPVSTDFATDVPPGDTADSAPSGGSSYWDSIATQDPSSQDANPGVFDAPIGADLPPKLTDAGDSLRPADANDARQANALEAAAPVSDKDPPTVGDVNATPPSEEDLQRLAAGDLLTRGIRTPEEWSRVAKVFGNSVANQVQWETQHNEIPRIPDDAAAKVRGVITMYGWGAAGANGAKALGEHATDAIKDAGKEAVIEGAKSGLSDNGKAIVDFQTEVATVTGDVQTVIANPHLAPLVIAANSLEAQKQKGEALNNALAPGRAAVEEQAKNIVAQTLKDPIAGKAALDKAESNKANYQSLGYLRAQYWRAYLARMGTKG
jgi:hypothetical protein